MKHMCMYLENPAYVYVHEYPIKTRLYRSMASEKMAEFFELISWEDTRKHTYNGMTGGGHTLNSLGFECQEKIKKKVK